MPVGWVRASGPVIIPGPAGAWDDAVVYAPRLAKNLDGTGYRDAEGRYYLYYTASGSVSGLNFDATGLARSADLRTWTRVGNGPVLARRPGQSDQGDASAVTVLHDGSRFHMWYEGNARIGGTDFVSIHHGTSTDGITWVDRQQVLVQGSDGDAEDLYAPVVIRDGNTWLMWYTGHDRAGRFGMMHATAPAPAGPWSRASADYLFYPRDLVPSEAWVDNGVYHLIYFELTARLRELKLATSVDARTWTPRGATYVAGPAGSWDSGRVTWPSQIPVGSSWVMFYDGHNGRDRGIGYAEGSSRYGFIRGGTGKAGPPQGVRAEVTGSRVTLTWSAPESGDATQRYVLEAGSTYGRSEFGQFGLASSSASFDPVGNGAYFVRVKAENASGVGDASNEVAFRVGSCDAAPGAPGGLTVVVRTANAQAEVMLSWHAPTDGCAAATYVIEAGSRAGLSDLAVLTVPGTQLTETVIAPRGTYYVRIRAVSRSGARGVAGSDVIVRID